MSRCRLANGQQLNYLDIGSGPALVLLHGWAMSSAVFAEMATLLAQDFRLLIPDLRGHGASDPGNHYALTDFAADLQCWCNQLELERFSLLGWSLGGQIALQMAACSELPIERMVVVSSTPRFCQSADWAFGLPDTQVRIMQKQFRKNPVTTLDDFVSMMSAGEENALLTTTRVRDGWQSPDPDAGIQTLTTLRTTDLRNQLQQIVVPTLVHHGGSDTIIPASAGEFLAAELPNSELLLWSGIGHAPFISRPQQSQAFWKEFLL